MKTIADSLGLPAEHTFVEDKSMHSTENAKNGTKMGSDVGTPRRFAAHTWPISWRPFVALRVVLYTV